MRIVVNGNEREAPEDCGLLDLLKTLGLKPEATVAERNGTVIARGEYCDTKLAEGDILELIRFVGGG